MRLIDADAFKEYLKNAFEEVKHMYPDGGRFARQITEDFCRDIDEQPTINAESHWVPVTERLPENSGRYLVTALDGTDRRTTVVPYHPQNKTWTLTGRMAYWNWRVLAWMPLPEPYVDDIPIEYFESGGI